MVSLTTQHVSKITVREARNILGFSQKALAKAANVSVATIRSIENGSAFKTQADGAKMVADALGLGLDEIEWPRGLSHLGRPAGTGKAILHFTLTVEYVFCAGCSLALPRSGNCDFCNAA